MTARRFTNTTGNHFKFWSIERVGKSNVVRYGRIGTAGQVRTKRFRMAAAAAFAASRLVTEKLLKGYVEDDVRLAATFSGFVTEALSDLAPGETAIRGLRDIRKPCLDVPEAEPAGLPEGRMITFGDE